MVLRGDDSGRLTLVRRDFIDAVGVDAHAAWAAGRWPSVAAAFHSRALEPFYSHAASLQLGDITVQYATGSARALDRPATLIAEDGLSALVVGVHFDGMLSREVRGRTVLLPPGALLLLDLAQPCRVAIPASRSIQFAMPRSLAEEYLGSVAKLHGRVVPAAAATLFVDYVKGLRAAVGGVSATQAPRLGRILLDLLAVAARHDPRGAGARARAVSPATIREGIAASLELPVTSIAALCQRLGVSRSTLSRMFKEEGGIETHLRNLRLERVRMALANPTDTQRIAALAERWGFTDASHLTRAFRARYGVTPSAMRPAVAR